MWRNQEVLQFADWLRGHNASLAEGDRVSFNGLDVYSLSESIHAVLAYLDKVDAKAAEIARQRYGCLTPWQDEPAHYGRAVMLEGRPSCEDRAVEQLRAMLSSRLDYLEQDGEDRKSVVEGKGVSGRVDLGGGRIIKKKKR